MIEFKDSSNPISELEIEGVERKFGFTYPEPLRQLYLVVNGGRPSPNRIYREADKFILHEFLPIKYSRSPISTVEISIQRLKVDKLILPAHLIPFAIDPGGNYYCFKSNNIKDQSIVLFYMDHWNDLQYPTRFVAESIGDLLDSLTERRRV